jgi:TPR repeat protein
VLAKYQSFETMFVREGIAGAKLNGKWGFVDTMGKAIGLFKYDSVSHFVEGVAGYGIKTKDNQYLWGFIDRKGKELTAPKYIKFDSKSGKYFRVWGKDAKVGLIDRSGKELLATTYTYIGEIKEGVRVLYINKGDYQHSYGFIDENGKMITSMIYNQALDFTEGRAAVRKGSKWGYINRVGKEVIPIEYDWAGPFVKGLAAVNMDGTTASVFPPSNGVFGYIDTTGKYVLPLHYYGAQSFDSNTLVAAVLRKGGWGVIDRNGMEVLPYQYSGEESRKLISNKALLEQEIKRAVKPISSAEATQFYDQGISAYKRGEYTTAFVLWKKAAERGNQPEAMYQLGMLYANGEGVKQDITIAEEWLKKALAKNVKWAKEPLDQITKYKSSGQEELNTAKNAYDKGDYINAINQYTIAAERGNAEAMVNLGVMFFKGQGTAIQKSKAIDWWKQAAAKGNEAAYIHLGGMYYEGAIGIPKDYKQAMEWYQKAALKNNPEALFMIGDMYEKGLGVPPNKTEALQWYRKSAQRGYERAKVAVGNLKIWKFGN